MRINVEFHASDREAAARQLSLIEHLVMQGFDKMERDNKRVKWEDVAPLNSGTRTVKLIR